MCVPGCQEHVARAWTRRGFFSGVAAAAAAAGAARIVTAAAPAHAAERSFSRVVDLTHTMWAEFPTFFGTPQLELEVLKKFDPDGFNMLKWHVVEHTGTHLDAPIHFSADGADAAAIPVDQLVVPLCVVDISARAAADADTQLTPDDLTAWEAKNGAFPDGCCVAMNSGWDQHVATDKYRNADDKGMHFPGFHAEATAWMLERNILGMAVDTLSLDYGQSADFKTHYMWLPAGRWGLECVANLGQVPETGAAIVLGGPKIGGATGGPSRVLALV